MWVPALMLQTLFWTLPQEVQVAIHDTVLSCSVRTGGSVYTVQSTLSKTAAFKERSCGPPKLSHSWHGSFGHHHLHKLLIVDLTIAIHVGFADHLIDFLISKLPQWNIRHKSQVRAIRMRFHVYKDSLYNSMLLDTMFIHELGSSVRLPIQIWESFKHT